MATPACVLASILRAAIVVALLVPAAAASTWTVDDSGGADFLSLAAAVAAPEVLDGDTLRVEPGTYGPFVTGKALTIIGRAGGSAPHVTGESRIDGAARATLAGLQLDELILLHIPGRATLEDVDVGHFFIQSFGLFNDSFRIEDCAEVVVSNSNLHGKTGNENWYESPGVDVRDSRASLVNCTIQGGDGGDGDFGFPGQPGVLVLDGSVAVVAGCTITGGSGGTGVKLCSSQGAYGIEIEHSTLWICGDGADVIAGGNDCPSFQKPEAVGGWYSQVTVSGVTLVEPALASGLLATGTVVFPNPAQPFLFVGGDPTPGAVRRLNVTGPEGATALVFFSLQPLFADLPKLTSGPLWLDPSAPLILLPLVLGGPHQPVTVNLPLPRQPAYAGITAWVQGFVAAGGGQFLDTNPASIVLRF
jgi:hypothetical protein